MNGSFLRLRLPSFTIARPPTTTTTTTTTIPTTAAALVTKRLKYASLISALGSTVPLQTSAPSQHVTASLLSAATPTVTAARQKSEGKGITGNVLVVLCSTAKHSIRQPSIVLKQITAQLTTAKHDIRHFTTATPTRMNTNMEAQADTHNTHSYTGTKLSTEVLSPSQLHPQPPASTNTSITATTLFPPTVRGMKTLDRSAFEHRLSVPHLIVDSKRVGVILKKLKKNLLKMSNIKAVIIPEENPDIREIRLNPELVKGVEDVRRILGMAKINIPAEIESMKKGKEKEGKREDMESENVQSNETEMKDWDAITALGPRKEMENHSCEEEEVLNCVWREMTVTYDNLKAEDILRAVLPEDQEGAQSYSLVGHILHLNLGEHILPYKHLIGQVYLDKVVPATMVVNKTSTIDNTFRNFEMEVLAGGGEGSDNTVVTVRENGCVYEFDFARVYWNPRLSTEHERIVKKMKHRDVLYDVMAGVGPFAIPAARKKVYVVANDLNPCSFNAMVNNCDKNKVKDYVQCHNVDAHTFITTILKPDLLTRWGSQGLFGSIHIVMNLPALAVTFLPAFRGLFRGVSLPQEGGDESGGGGGGEGCDLMLPVVHVYMFNREATEEVAIGRVAEWLLGCGDGSGGDCGGGGEQLESVGVSSSCVGNGGDISMEIDNGGGIGDSVSSGDTVALTKDSIACANSSSSSSSSSNGDNNNRTDNSNTQPKTSDTSTVRQEDVERLREHVVEVVHVRQVAPNKAMMRVSFKIPREVLFGEEEGKEGEEKENTLRGEKKRKACLEGEEEEEEKRSVKKKE